MHESTPPTRKFATEAWWRAEAGRYRGESVAATPGFVDALRADGGSLLISARQGGVLLLLRVDDTGCNLVRMRMPGAMGAAVDGDTLLLGTAFGLRVYRDLTAEDARAAHYLPVAMHTTGGVSVHEVGFADDGALWFVNTAFSALCTVDARSHFRLRWRPAFVTHDGPLDCCHLNGMAMAADGPRYATALAASDGAEGWRAHGPDAGVLLEVRGGGAAAGGATDHIVAKEIVADGLSMPHSPTLREGAVWLLESGRGLLSAFDPARGALRRIGEVPGIARGLALSGATAFVGLSTPRAASGAVAELLRARFPAHPHGRVFALDAASGAQLGSVELPGIEEIASIARLPKPDAAVLYPDAQRSATTFVVAY